LGKFAAIIERCKVIDTSQDETDGFYYDQLKAGNDRVPLRIRSMVGLIPLCAVNVLKSKDIENLHGFKRRMEWFLTNRKGTNTSKHAKVDTNALWFRFGSSHLVDAKR
jgi:hypothetical protein